MNLEQSHLPAEPNQPHPYSPDALYEEARAAAPLSHFGRSSDSDQHNPRALDERPLEMPPIPNDALWRSVFEGSWPDDCFTSAASVQQLHENIVLRFTADAAVLARAASLQRFRAFLCALAAESGMVLRYGRLAEAAGVTAETVKRWVRAAEEAGLIYLLQPWPKDAGLQLMRSPKILWIDTGIIAAFLGLESPEAMAEHPAADRFLETFAATLIMKSWADGRSSDPSEERRQSSEESPHAFYYMRDSRGFSIDLVIETPQRIHGIIVEKTGLPVQRMLRAFKTLAGLPLGKPSGVCALVGLEAPLKILSAKTAEAPGIVRHGFERLSS